MSLDLAKVVSQVSGMVARLRSGRDERSQRLLFALDTLRRVAANPAELERKLATKRTTWLVAALVDALDERYPAPPPPLDFTVLASDGSHIEVDRHKSVACYLTNIGSVALRYGPSPDATLESFPTLYFEDGDLAIPSPEPAGREQPMDSTLLGVKRSVEECRELSRLAAQYADRPALALLDGSLILWNLEPYPDFVSDSLLAKGFLKHLDAIMKLTQSGSRVALASYISFPGSTDVVNALRVALCPIEPVDCDRCPGGDRRPCDRVSGVRDRELFWSLLDTGERSALFISESKIMRRYGPHQVYFFYVRTGDEVARVEIPRWVATNQSSLNLVHSLVLDQCRRGRGYPVALSEAHEKAVVTGADRESFWRLVESSLAEEHLPTSTSAKSQSKRTRWV